MENLIFLIAPISAIVALIFAYGFYRRVMKLEYLKASIFENSVRFEEVGMYRKWIDKIKSTLQ